jgi:regulatory protein
MGKITAIKKLKRLYRVDLSGFDDEDKNISF